MHAVKLSLLTLEKHFVVSIYIQVHANQNEWCVW